EGLIMSGDILRKLSGERIFKDEESIEERPERSGQAAEYQRKAEQGLAIASIISRVNGVMR
ncbi:MAG: hypothetical protein ACI4RK_07445, partial [Oscillospiraceae bacterium]